MSQQDEGTPGTRRRSIEVRPARLSDVEALAAICAECFPCHIGWQVPALARRYWEEVLESSSSETWMWSVDDVPAAFLLLVRDVRAFLEVRKRVAYDMRTRMAALATRPGLVALKAREKFLLVLRRYGKGAKHSHRVPVPVAERIRREDFSQDPILYGGVYVDPIRIVWNELVGVLPAYRRFGLAVRAIRLSIDLARENGFAAIGCRIESSREGWRQINERFGFLQATEDESGHSTYVRLLDDSRVGLKELVDDTRPTSTPVRCIA